MPPRRRGEHRLLEGRERAGLDDVSRQRSGQGGEEQGGKPLGEREDGPGDGHEKELAAKISELPEPAQVAKAGGEEGDYGLAGLAVQDLDRDTAQELGLKGKVQGVVVTGVEPDSGADRAGLMPGDVIREINRKPVKSVQDYEKAASSFKKGDNVLMLINRRGASLFLSAKV